jgi:uncharacterized protein (TIGR02145 family)
MKHFYHFLMILFIFGFTNKLYSQTVPSYVPSNGLVGWWGFNGNAQDGSGNGNHGTVNGATLTTDRFGNQNGAYSFDGVDDYIQGVFTNFPLGGSARTISAWIYLTQTNTNYVNFVASWGLGTSSQSSANQAFGFVVNSPNQIGIWQAFGISQNVEFFNNANIPLNTYTNAAVTIDYNGYFIFYINGIPVYNNVIIGMNTIANNNVFNLGKSSHTNTDGWAGHFLGQIDDIGIWNRALTPQEITNLYTSQLPTQTSLCLPTITTSTPTYIGIDSVVVGGDILNDGGSSIVLRGVCYSTTPNPNMGNMRTEDGSGTGSFNTVLRGLTSSTTYYARSYAKNSNGVVVYGNELNFLTLLPSAQPCPGTPTVTDIDGNAYNTVQIGNQCWTQSNLKVSKYRNGDNIPTGLSNWNWASTTTGAYSIYNNNNQLDNIFGKLYNFYSVIDTRGLCPVNWHVPTEVEWTILEDFLGGNISAGGKLKSTLIQPSTGGWNFPNTGASNSSGFHALPAGDRTSNGDYTYLNVKGNFWTTTSYGGQNSPYAIWRHLNHDSDFFFYHSSYKRFGYSVRCLKD